MLMCKTAPLFTHKYCPECGEQLTIRSGKHGAFFGCLNYPACHYTHPLKNHTDGHIIKLLKEQYCPECQSELVLRQGRYGMFIGCSDYPKCSHTEIIDRTDQTAIFCPQCRQGKLVRRHSRYGKAFHSCDDYPECQFSVNFTPVAGVCAFCHFPLLIEKPTASGFKRLCASKLCKKLVDTGNNSGQ